MSDSKVIDKKDLPGYFIKESEEKSINFDNIKEWKEFKRISEKFFIEKKLREYNNNLAKTAREINLPRSNLYKKIENLGINNIDNREADNGPPRNYGEESPGSAGKDGF